MLPPLLQRVDRAVLTQPDSAPESRRWDPAAARAAVGGGTGPAGSDIEVVIDFAAAVRRAATVAAGGTVVVTGSCHTVGDALRILGRVPFDMASI
jgi:folylpolyglutamate synthase/dihydropteroate synthase